MNGSFSNIRNIVLSHREIFIFSFFAFVFLIYGNHSYPEIFWADDVYHLQHSHMLSEGNMKYAVDGWTRPMYAIPCAGMIRLFGYSMFSCRLMNIFFAVSTGLLLYFIVYHFTGSKLISFFPVAGFLLTPFVIHTMYSTLSEIELGFAIIAGACALVYKKPKLSASIIGLTPLIRSEGLIVVGIWLLYHFLTERDIKKLLAVGVLLAIPSVLWSIASYVLLWNWLPFTSYPLNSPYNTPSFIIYVFNTLRGFGVIFSIMFIIGAVRILRSELTEDNLKLLLIAFVVLTALFFHATISHFYLFGSVGSTEYMVSFFPLALVTVSIFLNDMFRGTSSRRNLSVWKISIILFSILVFQAFLFYKTVGDNYFSRPFNQDTIWFAELSQYFYDEILPRNETVKVCGVQVLYNTGDNYFDTPIQIRFQHNPKDEMLEICPSCSYWGWGNNYDTVWVIWNEGWCKQWDGGWLMPEKMLNSSYELVKEIGSKKVYRISS